MTIAVHPAVEPAIDAGPFRVGQPGARLLAGPPAAAGPESLQDHAGRLGRLPDDGPVRLLGEIERSNLTGRGGGGFPVGRKLAVGHKAAAGRAVQVIVNASESEPASIKDRTLCTLRPHLVLDGAAVAAAIVGASRVVLYAHRGADGVVNALRHAVAERRSARLPDPPWLLGVGPARYVSGEASAAASWVEGGQAKPQALRLPLATAGVSGCPTIVHNVETLAHLGLIARFGAEWWRQAGSPRSPGSRLATVHHGGPHGAVLFEVVAPVAVGRLLAPPDAPQRCDVPSAALLIGGYAGRWGATETIEGLPFSADALATVGLTPGCGVIAPLPRGACGVAAMADLVRWLAAESAGQCGPCVYGLADIAEGLHHLVQQTSNRREVRNLRRLLGEIRGKGACHHPDGVVGMVQSGLDVFETEVDRHARRRGCGATVQVPSWPLPSPEARWR